MAGRLSLKKLLSPVLCCHLCSDLQPGYISVRKTAKVRHDEEKIPLKTAVNTAADVKPACFTQWSKMGKKVCAGS